MTDCIHFKNGICSVISNLAEAEVAPLENVCNTCQKCPVPMTVNYVTASSAVHYWRRQGDKRTMDLIFKKVEPYLSIGSVKPMPGIGDGVGTELHGILKEKGWEMEPGCKCLEHVIEMNQKGPEWCQENIKQITTWMLKEFHRRYPGSSLFDWIAGPKAENLVQQAIDQYNAKHASK